MYNNSSSALAGWSLWHYWLQPVTQALKLMFGVRKWFSKSMPRRSEIVNLLIRALLCLVGHVVVELMATIEY